MATALALASLPVVAPLTSEVSTTLSVGAGVAYEVFADAIEVPRWLPIIQTAKVLARTPEHRPAKVAFTRNTRIDRGACVLTSIPVFHGRRGDGADRIRHVP